MSIASRITSIEGHIEEDYNALERLGADLTNVDKNIENIANVVNDIYDKLPKVTGTGSDLSLTPTLKGGLNIVPLGNTEQEGTPTPDNPQNIRVVTGENSVVVQNKNLFNGVWELGYIDGTTGQNASNNNLIRCKDYIEVTELTTYKFSVDNPNIVNMLIYEYKTDFTYNLTTNKAINIANDYLTTNANTKYIRFRPGYQTTDTSLKCQVEKGTVATSYIPHQEQSYTLHLGSLELCKIGDYQDVITGTKDNWKVVKNVGKVDLSNYTYDSHPIAGTSYNRRTTNQIPNIKYVSVNTELGNGLCEKYINHTGQGMSGVGAYNCFAIDVSLFQVTSIESPTGLFYYALETPTEETITDTSVVQSLNELNDLMSYDGTTNIVITSNSANAQLTAQISALKGE